MRPQTIDGAGFDELAAAGGSDLISVFVPTHEKGRNVAQDRVHLKNGLAEVDGYLTELGWRPRERSARLSRAQGLLDDLEFWEHQRKGLAVYVDEAGAITPVSISTSVGPLSLVMPVFHVRPLTADIDWKTHAVLVLSKDDVALFTVGGGGAEPVDLELPAFKEVNWFVDREPQRQQHPDQPGQARNRHGQESAKGGDEDTARFLRAVDAALDGISTQEPLIVLGDNDLTARFVNFTERPTSSPENSGIATPFSTEDIAKKVAGVIAGFERDRINLATATAMDHLGVGKATKELTVAIPAAVTGRVEAIVMNRNADLVWGRLDRTDLEVEVHEAKEPGDVDLLDRLLVWARGNGAEIVVSEHPVDDGALIATFRY